MKKFWMVLLAGAMAISIASCGGTKGEKVTLYRDTYEGDDVKLSAEFTYPSDSDIIVKSDGKNLNMTELLSEENNYKIKVILVEDTTYDDNKGYAKDDEETYTEFKIGKYDCYGYEYMGGYKIFMHFEELSETSDRYAKIEVRAYSSSGENSPKGFAIYNDNKEVKDIVDSIVYDGVVEYPPEGEEQKAE